MAKKLKWEDMTAKEREAYVNQDYVPQREILVKDIDWLGGVIQSKNGDSFLGGIEVRNSDHLKRLIKLLHEDGMDVSNIIYHLHCSERYVYMVLSETEVK